MKQYTSLKEIDASLRILKLQREISGEQLKFRRQMLQSHFQVPTLMDNLGSSIKKSLIFVLSTLLLRKIRNHTTKKALES